MRFHISAMLLLGVLVTTSRVASTSTKKPVPKPNSAARVWHTAAPGATAPRASNGLPMLVIHSLNTNDRAELTPFRKDGGFSAADLDRAAFVVREPGSGNRYPIEPRLVDLVYRLSTHFDAPEIRVVSCYRTPTGKSRSNHGRGRAIDFVVPGASDEDVAKVAREFGFVGVGIYPTSGFLHMDVRDRSYFWIDRSGPGKKNRARGILPEVAHKSDLLALARGEKPAPPFFIGTTVDTGPSASDGVSVDETDDEDNDEAVSP